MAERLNKRHQNMVRSKIQASQLINRLQDHALGPVPIMDSTQVNAALRLLNKIVPDLQATELDIGSEGLTVNLVHRGNKPSDD